MKVKSILLLPTFLIVLALSACASIDPHLETISSQQFDKPVKVTVMTAHKFNKLNGVSYKSKLDFYANNIEDYGKERYRGLINVPQVSGDPLSFYMATELTNAGLTVVKDVRQADYVIVTSDVGLTLVSSAGDSALIMGQALLPIPGALTLASLGFLPYICGETDLQVRFSLYHTKDLSTSLDNNLVKQRYDDCDSIIWRSQYPWHSQKEIEAMLTLMSKVEINHLVDSYVIE